MIDDPYQYSQISHNSKRLDITTSYSLAELIGRLMFKIWTRIIPPSKTDLSDFISFVAKVISSGHPNVTPPILLTSLLYVKRLRLATKSQIPLGSKCEFRIWFTALMLADNYLNDNAFNCRSWHHISGLPVSECSKMKTEFLRALRYSLHVTEDEYGQWLRFLEGQISQKADSNDQNQIVPIKISSSISSSPILNMISNHHLIGLRR